jgi:hypothetical protein
MMWMPMLLVMAACGGVVALQRLDVGRLGEARLLEMLAAALTFVVAAISLGRAAIGTGMGPSRAILVLALAAASAYAVFLIGRGQDVQRKRSGVRRYISPETSRRRSSSSSL